MPSISTWGNVALVTHREGAIEHLALTGGDRAALWNIASTSGSIIDVSASWRSGVIGYGISETSVSYFAHDLNAGGPTLIAENLSTQVWWSELRPSLAISPDGLVSAHPVDLSHHLELQVIGETSTSFRPQFLRGAGIVYQEAPGIVLREGSGSGWQIDLERCSPRKPEPPPLVRFPGI